MELESGRYRTLAGSLSWNATDPHSIVVRHGPSVKSDASFLAGTFLNGIVSSTVSTMFTGELGYVLSNIQSPY